jgi:hypothetical protein
VHDESIIAPSSGISFERQKSISAGGIWWVNFYLAHFAQGKQNALFDPSYVNQIQSFRSAEATLMLLCIMVTL